MMELTKDIDPKLSIDWGEKTIHKMYKPPGDIESNRYRKQDNTANCKREETTKSMTSVNKQFHSINFF